MAQCTIIFYMNLKLKYLINLIKCIGKPQVFYSKRFDKFVFFKFGNLVKYL